MKNLILLLLISILSLSSANAQTVYAKEYLAKASVDDLNIYLTKAKKVKKIGAIMLIGGPVVGVSGLGLFSLAWSGGGSSFMAGTGLIMFLGGIGTTVIGIPVFATGAVRKNKVTNAFSKRNTGMMMEISPTTLFNFQTETYYPGLTISLRF